MLDYAAPGAIDYSGVGTRVTITAKARELLEECGYAFPIVDGRMYWELNRGRFAEFDVNDTDDHSSMAIDMRDTETSEGPRVFLCQVFVWRRNGVRKHVHYVLNPMMPELPFKGLALSDPITEQNCMKVGFWRITVRRISRLLSHIRSRLGKQD